MGLLVVLNHHLTFAGLDGNRDDFVFQQPFFNGFLGSGQGGNRVFVHLFPGVAFLVGHFLSESPHQPTGFRVFKAVQEHMVLRRLARPHAVTTANTLKNVRCIGHAFHTTGNHNIVGAGLDHIVGKHGGFHARTAKLIDRSGTSAVR